MSSLNVRKKNQGGRKHSFSIDGGLDLQDSREEGYRSFKECLVGKSALKGGKILGAREMCQ